MNRPASRPPKRAHPRSRPRPKPEPQIPAREDTRGVHVWVIVMKAYRALQRHAERSIAELGFGLSDFATLEILLHKGSLTVCEIARRVGLTPGSASVALDRLERRGLIERQPHPTDRRTRVIHLTSKGRALIEKAFTEHAEAMERAMADFPAADREALVRSLRTLGKSAEASLS